MNLIKKIILQTMMRIISIIPRKKNVIVFGSWFGQKYADNTKYAFLYGLNNDVGYKLYWITKSKIVYKEMKSQGLPVKIHNSLSGILVQLTSKYFVSTIGYVDFQPQLLSGSTLINYWHGVGIKKTGYALMKTDSDDFYKQYNSEKIYFKNIVHYIVSTSPLMTSFFSQAFVDYKSIVEIGYPRNDLFFNSTYRVGVNENIGQLIKGKKIFLYMPTHRKEGKEIMDMNNLLGLDVLNKFLNENNGLLLIKKHYFHKNEMSNIGKYNCILDITNTENIDSQMLLYQTDVLITDYSSCVFDFLLLNRPIIHYCFDLIDYIKNDRDLYMNYQDTIVGPIARTREDLNKIVLNNLYDSYEYDDMRSKLKNMFYSVNNQKEVAFKFFETIDSIKGE